MKGSINPGGVKDASASLLRAFSGAPRCAMVGVRDVVYNCQITYSGNEVFIRPVGGFPNPPNNMPFGKWLVQTTLTVVNPITLSFKLAMATNVNEFDLGHSNNNPDGRFLVSGGWDKVFLKSSFFPTPQQATVNTSWFIQDPNDGQIHFTGPNLLSIADLDLSATTTQTIKKVLPEQNEKCIYQFDPYLFCTKPVFPWGRNQWGPGVNGFNQFQGWQMQDMPGGLYPNNTLLGTLQIKISRVNTVPLFVFSLAPPFTFNFTNKTFFNPALSPTWEWDFGDGSAHVTTFNASHTFPSTGRYIVKLSTTDATGETKVFTQIIDLPLIADFTYTTRQSFHIIPVTQFLPLDNSTGATTWDWDWGDGSPHGTTQAIPFPGHEYPRGQTFTVKLTVGDGAGHTASISKVVNT